MNGAWRRRLRNARGRRGLIAGVLVVLAGCGGSTTPTPSPHPTAATAKPTATATPIPLLPAPAIIQVENSSEGRPQSGLAAANLVYEYVAEGGIDRFSLFFFGPPPPNQQVGPVRSARTVTVQLAQIYQAFLAYSGASTYILGLLKSASFPSYNEDSAQGNLFRITSRVPPHNLYTDGVDLGKLSAMAHRPPVAYQLWQRSTAAASSGVPALRVTAKISPFEVPVFTWDPQGNGFTRTESTGLVIDPTTHAPVVIPTVIVQQVNVTTDTKVVDVDGHFGVDQAITGTGPAQVFTGGKEYTTTWTQPPNGPPQFALANGEPAPVAPGEVWICLVPTGEPAIVG